MSVRVEREPHTLVHPPLRALSGSHPAQLGVSSSELRQSSVPRRADNAPMEVSVLVPSLGKPDAIARLTRSMAWQTLEATRFEVIIGLDGTSRTIRSERARVIELPKAGPAATRNALLKEARGEVVLFLNDDVVAEPDLVERHLRAHRELGPDSERTLVLGSAPWAVPEEDTLFARMLRETSMVFFYDRMNADDPARDWGFRHAWTLNLSVHRQTALSQRFDERLRKPMYEDLEWAHRLTRERGVRVFFRPRASVTHHHAYAPAQYLEREAALGAEARRLAMVNPACAREIFGRDILEDAFVREMAELVQNEQASAHALRQRFLSLDTRPPSRTVDAHALYEEFRPLKRWMWRQGFVAAARRDSDVAAA